MLINRDDTGAVWQPDGTMPSGTFTYQSDTEQPDRGGPLVFSPDGKTLAGGGSAATPGHLRLWDASNGQLIREAPAHGTGIAALAWSPQGTLVATTGDDLDDAGASDPDASDASPSTARVVKLWSAADGTLFKTLTGHEDIVSSVAFSPDGTLVASADREGRVRLWSTSDGAVVRELAKPPNPRGLTTDAFNGSVAFSPDGRWLASRGVAWTKATTRTSRYFASKTAPSHASSGDGARATSARSDGHPTVASSSEARAMPFASGA